MYNVPSAVFLGPCLQGGELLERRQIVAAARRDQFLDRCRLRQIRQQALGASLFWRIPDAPEIGKEWRAKRPLSDHGEPMASSIAPRFAGRRVGTAHALADS